MKDVLVSVKTIQFDEQRESDTIELTAEGKRHGFTVGEAAEHGFGAILLQNFMALQIEIIKADQFPVPLNHQVVIIAFIHGQQNGNIVHHKDLGAVDRVGHHVHVGHWIGEAWGWKFHLFWKTHFYL